MFDTDKARITEYINGHAWKRGHMPPVSMFLIKKCILKLMHMKGETYSNWSKLLQQHWIIADHWSGYHDMVAHAEGWGLSHVNGAWAIVSVDPDKFATDEAAHNHVKMNEHDVMNRIYAQAIEAVVMGNFKGISEDTEWQNS